MAAKNGLVKAEAQIIPRVDQENLIIALAELQDELACLPAWKAKAEAWIVDGPEQYKAAGEFRATLRSQGKVPKFKIEPFQEVVDRARDFLKTTRKDAESQFQAIDDIITAKMDAQATRERLAAEAEERRVNEEKRIREEKEAAELRRAKEAQAEAERKERAKEIAEAQRTGELKKREAEKLKKEAEEKAARDRAAAAKEEATTKASFQPVTVKPNLPSVTGSRRHRNYYADYTDFDMLLGCYVRALDEGQLPRATFLRQFIMENLQKLGEIARDTKDSKKLEGMIPGIHAWDKDKS